jgi:hypothetical protein
MKKNKSFDNKKYKIIQVPAIKKLPENFCIFNTLNPLLPDLMNESEQEFIHEQNYQFFLYYIKLYETNVQLKEELKLILEEKSKLKQKIIKLEKKFKNKEITALEKKINDTYINRKVKY